MQSGKMYAVAVYLLLSISTACSDSSVADDGNAEDGAVAALAAADTVLSLQELSLLLAPELVRNDLKLSRIIAQSRSYYALAASGSKHCILLAHSSADTIMLIGDPIEVPAIMNRYPEVEWLSMGADSTHYLRFTKDDVVQGETGTELFRVEGAELVSVYMDRDRSCQPAQVRDIDDDGVPEILAFVDIPAGAVCSSICEMEIREQFEIMPSWITVLKWIAGNWIVADEGFPEFYQDQADRYERIAVWLSSDLGQRMCGSASWLREGLVFEQWAQRARDLAGRHD